MDFQEARTYLIDIFQRNDFNTNVRLNRRHVSQVIIDTCSNGSQISVSFPGYKAYINGDSIVYDYRVDITKEGTTTALSHTNIIADIYNKVVNCRLCPEILESALLELLIDGRIDANNLSSRLSYTSTPPSLDLLQRVRDAHGNKTYNTDGNTYDLTPEELFRSIKWITLQEDINYPIFRNYEGRRMSFARYMETIFITQNPSYTLEQVISRALSHSRPRQWQEMDYSFRDQIQ